MSVTLTLDLTDQAGGGGLLLTAKVYDQEGSLVTYAVASESPASEYTVDVNVGAVSGAFDWVMEDADESPWGRGWFVTDAAGAEISKNPWGAVAKTDVVAAAYVVSGHDNYTGGDHGDYPTTETTLDTTARTAIIADKANILKDHAITVSGMTTITGSDRGTLDVTEDNAPPEIYAAVKYRQEENRSNSFSHP